MVNASTRGVDSSPAKKLLNNHNSRNQTITRAVESPEPKKMENHELDKTDKAHGRPTSSYDSISTLFLMKVQCLDLTCIFCWFHSGNQKERSAIQRPRNFRKICLPIFSAIVWIRTLLDDPRSEGDDVNVYCMWKRSNHLHVNPTRVTRLLYKEICSCTTAGKSCAVIIHC